MVHLLEGGFPWSFLGGLFRRAVTRVFRSKLLEGEESERQDPPENRKPRFSKNAVKRCVFLSSSSRPRFGNLQKKKWLDNGPL